MADVDINPFGEHDSRPEEPMGENIPLTLGGGSTWRPECEQETFRGESQRTKLMKDRVKGLYLKLSERMWMKPQKHFILIISNSEMGNCTTKARTHP